MANKKKEVYKPKPMTENKRNIIQALLDVCNKIIMLNNYQITMYKF